MMVKDRPKKKPARKPTSFALRPAVEEKAKRILTLFGPTTIVNAAVLCAAEMEREDLEQWILRVAEMDVEDIQADMRDAEERLGRLDDQSNQGRGKAKGA